MDDVHEMAKIRAYYGGTATIPPAEAVLGYGLKQLREQVDALERRVAELEGKPE